MMKTCYKCKIIQPYENFGLLKTSKDGHRYDCKNCRKLYRLQNKDHIISKSKAYYQENKQTLNQQSKEYRIQNSAKIKKQRSEYRQKSDVSAHIKKKNKEYLPIRKEKIKLKRINDLNFKLSEILRSKFNRAIKKNKYSNFLGCDVVFLKMWLEFNFTNDMTWDNIGKVWHIDHVLPISLFDFTQTSNINICFNWTNLQPMKSTENISKSNKIYLHQYFNNIISIFRFNKKYKQFVGYQAVNESLQWLRNNYSGMVKMPHMKLHNNLCNEMDNPHPSS